MSENNSSEVVLADSIFTPVMDVKAATKGFRDFQKLKMEILSDSDIVEIMGKDHVKKSGWNKLALFFGVSTRTVKSEKTHNPDGSYEWMVTVEAYKKNKEGQELFNVQRSAIVSSLEKEKSEGQRNSPRKSHDVFASSETRAEGRALAAIFGTGEVSAEEMEGHHDEAPKGERLCLCSLGSAKISDTISPKGAKMCASCGGVLTEEKERRLQNTLQTTP